MIIFLLLIYSFYNYNSIPRCSRLVSVITQSNDASLPSDGSPCLAPGTAL